MSIKLMSLAWDLPIKEGLKITLLALCDRADDHGMRCFPSIALLAKKCSISKRSIYKRLRELEAMQLIAIQRKTGSVNHYLIHVQRLQRRPIGAPDDDDMKKNAPAPESTHDVPLEPVLSLAPVKMTSQTGEDLGSGAVNKLRRTGEASAPYTSSNHHVNVKDASARARDLSKSLADKPIDVDAQIWQDFLQLRQAKRSPLTKTALRVIETEAVQAGLCLEQALEMCCFRGWQVFKAAWIKTDIKLNEREQLEQSNLEIAQRQAQKLMEKPVDKKMKRQTKKEQ